MRSAHTQCCHEPKACTSSPARVLYFFIKTNSHSGNGQPAHEHTASGHRRWRAGKEEGRSSYSAPPLLRPPVRHCFQAIPLTTQPPLWVIPAKPSAGRRHQDGFCLLLCYLIVFTSLEAPGARALARALCWCAACLCVLRMNVTPATMSGSILSAINSICSSARLYSLMPARGSDRSSFWVSGIFLCW